MMPTREQIEMSFTEVVRELFRSKPAPSSRVTNSKKGSESQERLAVASAKLEEASIRLEEETARCVARITAKVKNGKEKINGNGRNS